MRCAPLSTRSDLYKHTAYSYNETPPSLQTSLQRHQATDVNNTTTKTRHHLTMILYTTKQSLPVNPSVILRSEVTTEWDILWFMNNIRQSGCQNKVHSYQLL